MPAPQDHQPDGHPVHSPASADTKPAHGAAPPTAPDAPPAAPSDQPADPQAATLFLRPAGRPPAPPHDATLAAGQTAAAEDISAQAATLEAGPERLEAGRLRSATPGDARLRVPGYEILEELGRGGMGVVFKARQVALRRLVALKVILGGSLADAEDLRRFRVEAEAVAGLQHPNIVQVHEVGEHNGLAFLTLEYAGGGDLRGRLAGAPLAPREAARLTELLARASEFAHRRGVIHRDLKPANVLFDEAGAPKIADFGLAKRLGDDSERTRTGVVLGTPSYMAPEQARGRTADVTPAVDVYALGAILYECLAGRPPFKAATAPETMDQVLHRDPAPPTRLQPKTPRDLETICLKCLEKEPRRRYASAGALADDLRRFLDGQPIAARPTPAWERAWKWARRRPDVAVLSAAVVLTVVLGFALVTWQWLRADREWRRAEDKAQLAQKATGLAEQRKGEADDARRRAEEGQAHLALAEAHSLCESGEVGRGLLWFAEALDLADRAEAHPLDRPIRIGLADWSGQLSRPDFTMACGNALTTLEFSPDGKTLMAASKGKVSFWDAANGQESGAPLPHKRFGLLSQSLLAARFSPDGTKVLTGSDDGNARLWSMTTRQQIIAPMDHDHPEVWSVAFTPDGKQAATACGDGAARLWDLETGRMIGKPLQHSSAQMFRMALSHDGSELFTASRDGLVKRWRVPSGEPIGPPLEHESQVTLLLAHPRDGRVVTGTVEGKLKIWAAHGGAAMRPTALPPPGAQVVAGAFSADGRLLAVATTAGLVRMYDTDSLLPVGPTFRHDAEVRALAISPDGAKLAAGEEGGTVRLWAMPAAKAVGEAIRCDWAPVSVDFDRAGTELLVVEAGQWRVLDLASGRTLSRRREHTVIVSGALSPDGKTVVVGQWFGAAQLCDAATGESVATTQHQGVPVRVAAFSPDGAKLFTASEPQTLDISVDQLIHLNSERAWLWDMATRRPVRPLLRGLTVPVSQAAFGPDGNTLLLGCGDHMARFWDPAEDRQDGASLVHASSVTAVALAPNGRTAATGCRDGTARLWDVAARAPLSEPLRCEDEVTAVRFSPDGRTLLTACRAGIARFWDVATGEPLGVPLRHPDAVVSAAYAPDGRSVATACADRAARRWRTPPPPLEGGVERLRLWVETLTGMELDDAGDAHDLTPEAVEQRRRRLGELGGPPTQ